MLVTMLCKLGRMAAIMSDTAATASLQCGHMACSVSARHALMVTYRWQNSMQLYAKRFYCPCVQSSILDAHTCIEQDGTHDAAEEESCGMCTDDDAHMNRMVHNVTADGESRGICTLRRACFASTAVMRLKRSLFTPFGNLMGIASWPCMHKAQ